MKAGSGPRRPGSRALALATSRLMLLLLPVVLAACATPRSDSSPSAAAASAPDLPEPASGLVDKPGWAFDRQAVVAAHPLAAEAGARILRQGGNALDAAIAAKLALAVVEPQSSGIGGGAFLLHWSGSRLAAWDGRETAPAAADEALFLRADGRPMGARAAQIGGRAVGVPGAVRMLEAAHRRDGRLPWAALFAPAIELAAQGFPLGPRLHRLLDGEAALREDPLARALYFDVSGAPHPVGHRLHNPALAAVLRQIAAQGSAALHAGPIAADIVARVRGHAGNPGRMQAADLAGYAPVERAPLCTDWGARWRVCGFPPPSSGHLTLMQILGLLAQADAQLAPLAAPPPDAQAPADAVQRHARALHLYAEASRLAFADRALYAADPAFVPAPGGDWARLLAPDYLARRGALIGPRRMESAPPGDPATPAAARARHSADASDASVATDTLGGLGAPRPANASAAGNAASASDALPAADASGAPMLASTSSVTDGASATIGTPPGPATATAELAAPWPFAAMPAQPAEGTSHLSVADAEGGVVVLTTTIEAVFGARLSSDGGTGLPGGFLLNNQLTDFALAPRDAAGRPVANRVEPGKRPRSSMSPTLVFDRATGQPVLATGSALGPIIIHAVARTLLATLEGGQDAQRAIDAPTFAQLEGPLLLEQGRFAPATIAALRALGHTVVETDLPTGLHALQRTAGGWFAGADPRREGEARGD